VVTVEPFRWAREIGRESDGNLRTKAAPDQARAAPTEWLVGSTLDRGGDNVDDHQP